MPRFSPCNALRRRLWKRCDSGPHAMSNPEWKPLEVNLFAVIVGFRASSWIVDVGLATFDERLDGAGAGAVVANVVLFSPEVASRVARTIRLAIVTAEGPGEGPSPSHQDRRKQGRGHQSHRQGRSGDPHRAVSARMVDAARARPQDSPGWLWRRCIRCPAGWSTCPWRFARNGETG
jgi:hypothetical protein